MSELTGQFVRPARTVDTAHRNADAPLALALTLLVLALKAPDALSFPQFWAEDGYNLFSQQHAHLLPQVFEHAAGYLIVVQRLVAWFASLFSALHAPAIYCIAALLINTWSMLSLRALSLPRAAFWAALVSLALLPTSGQIFGALINVQWLTQLYLLVPVARFLSGERSSRPFLAAAATVVVSLTGPFSVHAAAAAVVGAAALWVQARPRGNAAAFAALPRPTVEMALLFACALIQVGSIFLQFQGPRPPLVPSLQALIDTGSSLQLNTFGARWFPTLLFCAFTAAVAIVSVLAMRTPVRRAIMVATIAMNVVQLWTVACRHQVIPNVLDSLLTDRYYTLFRLFFWIWTVIAFGSLFQRRREWVLPGVLAATAAIAVANPPTALRRQPLADLDWKGYAERADRGEGFVAKINPIPWGMNVPPLEPKR